MVFFSQIFCFPNENFAENGQLRKGQSLPPGYLDISFGIQTQMSDSIYGIFKFNINKLINLQAVLSYTGNDLKVKSCLSKPKTSTIQELYYLKLIILQFNLKIPSSDFQF